VTEKVKMLTITFLSSLCLLTQTSAADLPKQLAGMPHRNSFEGMEYVSEAEFVGQVAPYVFTLVRYEVEKGSYSDGEVPFDGVSLRLFVFTLPDEVIYNGPITLEILDHGAVIHSARTESSDEMSLYGLEHSLPEAGKLDSDRFSLRVTLHGADDLQCTIPFFLASQRIPWGKWIGVVLLVLLFLVIFLVGKRSDSRAGSRKPANYEACKSFPIILLSCLFIISITACGEKKQSEPTEVPKSGISVNQPVTQITEGGDFSVTLRQSGGATIPLNEHFSLEVSIASGNGSDLDEDIQIVTDANMPAHQHGMLTKPETTKTGADRFRVDGMLFHMSGNWVITVDVSGAIRSGRAAFPVSIE